MRSVMASLTMDRKRVKPPYPLSDIPWSDADKCASRTGWMIAGH